MILVLAATAMMAFAENSIKVEAPEVVGLDEQFNVSFVFEGDRKPSDFQWNAGDDFRIIWGPQEGVSRSMTNVNGKVTTTSRTSYTYILSPKAVGKFHLPAATAKVKGNTVTSASVAIEVVANGGSSSSGSASSGNSSSSSVSGEIPDEDLFMRFTLSRTNAVIGEPITATLKLYQRVNVAGLENAKFPTFNGFWSQETEAPSNIEFKRESVDDKIYNTAVLRRYVIIPQQAGRLKIDPAELVVLVNVRTPSRGSSIFDSFFDDNYLTVRKRVTTQAMTVNVKPLPEGAPSSYSGGVGTFTISSRLSKDSLKTHDAASLFITLNGRGNVALLGAPKVNFPPDVEVYDMKTIDNTDKSNGGTSGSKTFEYPFIPRSHGDFTIEPVEYSYYDVNAGKYVTLRTEPMSFSVAKGSSAPSSSSSVSSLPLVERKGVRNLGEDIRYIETAKPAFKFMNEPFVGRGAYWVAVMVILAMAAACNFMFEGMAARRADVVGAKNRRATKMALRRLKSAGDLLSRNLYGAFYEELHRALLGFCSDKLNMGAEDLSKDNISEKMRGSGANGALVDEFVALLDACEYARYSPDGGHEEMKAHYDKAVNVISSIDSTMKGHRGAAAGAAIMLALLFAAPNMDAADRDSLWTSGVAAYESGKWESAAQAWESISSDGVRSAELYYNIGNAWFKYGNPAKAILYYERALKIDPSYKAARFNLDYANANIQDRIDSVPEFFLKTWARNLCNLLSSNAWAAVSLLMLALAAGLLVLFRQSPSVGGRRAGFYGAVISFIICIFAFGFACWGRSVIVSTDSAVVMTPVASVKSSPSSESAKDLFVLHEGTKVRIIENVGDWSNIELADGRQGWIHKRVVEII